MMAKDFNPLLRKPEHFEPPFPSTWEKVKGYAARSLALGPATIPVVDLHPKYQPVVDFPGLKADGIGAVIVKLTEADWELYGSPEYCYRAQDAGLGVMVYHFFRSDVSGSRQADKHLSALQPVIARLGYDPPTWADVETSDGVTQITRIDNLLNYLNLLQSYRKRSGFYSSPYLWQKLIGKVSWAPNFDGWLAHWTSASAPTLPVGWIQTMLRLWQIGVSGKHSWVPKVPAVESAVDYNLFYGTREQLRLYIGMDPQPPDNLQEQIDALDARVTVLENQEYKVVKV